MGGVFLFATGELTLQKCLHPRFSGGQLPGDEEEEQCSGEEEQV